MTLADRAAAILILMVLLPAGLSVAAGELRPLVEILQALSARGAQLIYSSETVPDDLQARVPPAGLPLETQLRQLLAPLQLEARRLENGAFVITRSLPLRATVNVRAWLERDGILRPAAGALLLLDGASRRVLTDADGLAHFADLPLGRHDIEARYEGAAVAVRSFQLTTAATSLELALSLLPPAPLAEIRVQGLVLDEPASAAGSASREVLEATPTTSSDAARTVQLLAGTASAGFTAKSHVRGSRSDEVLYRYDGVSQFDPYHFERLQSLSSAIDPSIIDSATVWSGVAPVQIAEAIGAVVDITPRRVTTPVADVRLSNRDFNLVAGTPFASAAGTLLAAAHLSNDYGPTRWLDADSPAPDHYDVLLRATWEGTSGTRIAAGLLAIDDRARMIYNEMAPQEHATPENSERYFWLRARQPVSSSLASETLLSIERSHGRLEGQIQSPGIEVGQLSNQNRHAAVDLREELRFTPGRGWSVLGGVERIQAHVDEGLRANATFAAPFVPGLQPQALVAIDTRADVHATALSYYGNVRWQHGDDTLVEAGARRDQRAFEAQYPGDHHWNFTGTLRHRLGDATTLSLGASRVTQAGVLEVETGADGLLGPPVPRRVRQLSVDLEQLLPGGWLARVGLYDKHERSAYQDELDVLSIFTLLPPIALGGQPVDAAVSRMRGLETTLESDRHRPLSGWITYSRSSAEDRLARGWVPRGWDQPNALQLGGRWSSPPWQLAALFSWHTGWPDTPLTITGTSGPGSGADRVSIGALNSERLPNFASLDLRGSWERPLGPGVFQVALELNDVTNSRDRCCRFLSAEPGAGGTNLTVTPGYWLGFSPQLTFRWHL